MATEQDKYDQEIDELMAYWYTDTLDGNQFDFRAEVRHNWEKASPLFQVCSRDYDGCFPIDEPGTDTRIGVCGCLTQIRSGVTHAWGPSLPYVAALDGHLIDNELTEQIRQDTRLPAQIEDVMPCHLPIFAEWQRKIDKAYADR